MIYGPIRVVHYGLGEMGSRIAGLTAGQRGLQIVGGIDRDPQKQSRDLGDVLMLDQPLGLQVADNATDLLQQTQPNIVIHATTSRFHEVYSQLAECIRTGANVISTCEELVYPYDRDPVPAEQLDRLARAHGVTVIGVGVNPGFIMDLLPLMLTAPCTNVQRISIVRVIDATTRRSSLQQRIGVGMLPSQFHQHVAHGAVQHIGMIESLQMLAHGLGWRLDRVHESIDPIIAQEWIRTPYITVAPEQAAGIHQIARGWLHGNEALRLTWQTAVGIRDSHDSIQISATPSIDLQIHGGLHGDLATAALVLHAIPQVLAASPGLKTVLDISPMHFQPRPEPQLVSA